MQWNHWENFLVIIFVVIHSAKSLRRLTMVKKLLIFPSSKISNKHHTRENAQQFSCGVTQLMNRARIPNHVVTSALEIVKLNSHLNDNGRSLDVFEITWLICFTTIEAITAQKYLDMYTVAARLGNMRMHLQTIIVREKNKWKFFSYLLLFS